MKASIHKHKIFLEKCTPTKTPKSKNLHQIQMHTGLHGLDKHFNTWAPDGTGRFDERKKNLPTGDRSVI